MPTITFEHDNYTGTIRAHRVYAKTAWSDEWELKEHLVCMMAKWTCAPQIGQASLYYRYGHAIVPGNPEAGYLQPFTLPTLAYVKIEFDVLEILDAEDEETETTLTWYGVVGSLVDQYGGSISHDGSFVPQGVQQLNAVGLEWLLDHQYVTDCWMTNNEESVPPTKINVAMPFNLPRREPVDLSTLTTGQTTIKSKNRSRAEKLLNAYTYVFVDHVESTGDISSGYFEETENWSTRDIVQYLLCTQAPRDISGNYPITWELLDTDNILPTWDTPEIEQQGVRVWQLLNQLISRQRCMGFYLQVADDVIQVVPYTFTNSDITVPDTTDKIPANANQKELELFGDLTANFARSTDCFSKYDQVKVVGARAVHIATLGGWLHEDGFYKDWRDEDETEYDTGYQSEGDFPAATELDDRYEYQVKWQHKPKFTKVYRRFRIDPTWDFKTIPYPETDEQFPVFPKDPDNAPMLDEPRTLPIDSMQIVPLPFWYDGTNSVWRPLEVPCRVFVRTERPDGNWAWMQANEIRGLRTIDGADEAREFFYSIELIPVDEPGRFDLVVRGAPKHKLTDFYTKPDWEPDYGLSLNYYDEDDFRITVGLTADYFCEAKYPADDQVPTPGDIHRVRIINAGDSYRLAFVPKGTNFYTRPNRYENNWDGLDYIDFDSRYLLDDRPKLLQIATQAYGWYGRDRVAISLQTSLITNGLWLGDMLTSVYPNAAEEGGDPEAVEVNTVITSITLTHQLGNGFTVPPPRIAYQTEHAEFDFLSFATQQK